MEPEPLTATLTATLTAWAAWVGVVVAASALVISVLAWRAAHRSAKAAERAVHQQQTPTFTAEIEPVNGGKWHRLAVRLDGPNDLDDLTVDILDKELIYVSDRNREPQPEEAQRRHVATDDDNRPGLAIGDTVMWRVAAAGKHVHGDQVTLRCIAKVGKAEWKPLVSVEVPRSLRPKAQARWV
ncbi:hypothetical protein ACN27G_27575 [Plantactinospora sp. WMMB334]|uniref:hypothetical protein n=1 Tax=Plantactinospora sp. WMMB334 TaxID=3404119 RepID=UPI003B95A272